MNPTDCPNDPSRARGLIDRLAQEESFSYLSGLLILYRLEVALGFGRWRAAAICAQYLKRCALLILKYRLGFIKA